MHNNTIKNPEEIEEALKTIWQMDTEMEIILAGLTSERESLYGDVRKEKMEGKSGEWVLGEMMGLDRAIALLTPID
jgi:hypothetical protein